MSWNPLHAPWTSLIGTHAGADGPPVTLATPEQAWAYGAYTTLVTTDAPTTVRITATALKGDIGFCLISEDYSSLASNQVLITPQQGEAVVELAFAPEKSPARLLVRNYNDNGHAGEVKISAVEIGSAG